MASAPAPAISEHLDRIPPAVRPTVEAARRTVKAFAPKAAEITYRSQPPRSNRSMWKILHYAVDDAYVVGIGVYPTYAVLYFYRGRELAAAGDLLEGGGKEMRFIRLHEPADADGTEVKRVVQKAFKLGGPAKRGAGR